MNHNKTAIVEVFHLDHRFLFLILLNHIIFFGEMIHWDEIWPVIVINYGIILSMCKYISHAKVPIICLRM